jgi:hypothetical protein
MARVNVTERSRRDVRGAGELCEICYAHVQKTRWERTKERDEVRFGGG